MIHYKKENKQKKISTEIDFEGLIPDTRMLRSTSTSNDNLGISPTKIYLPFLPVKVQFSASSSNGLWTLAGFPNKIGHVSRSKDAPLSQLVHPDLPNNGCQLREEHCEFSNRNSKN